MTSHGHPPRTPASPSWMWCGVHGAPGTVHPFLQWSNDPTRIYVALGVPMNGDIWVRHIFKILAGSGGLLLINVSQREIDVSGGEENEEVLTLDTTLESMQLSEPLVDNVFDSTSEADDQDQLSIDIPFDFTLQTVGIDGASLAEDQHWHRLAVLNPARDETRVLPPANSRDVGLEFWSYKGVQANLLVDVESQTYTVTLTFPDFVCLYSSTSNSWRCQRFNQGASWGPRNELLLANPWEMQVASAYVDGRLFFADVVVEDSIPTMNLIEIEAENGSWKRHDWSYSLQTEFTEFLDTPFLRMRGLSDHDYRMHQAFPTRTPGSRCKGSALENFQIVECVGELYAVIPMGLSEFLPMSLGRRRALIEDVAVYANRGLSFMPVQFLIVNMRGEGFVHGVLRIVIPGNMGGALGTIETEYRQRCLLDQLRTDPLEKVNWKFCCVAEGTVIWVAMCDFDYVLQYDVATGESKTEIIEEADSDATSLDIWGDGFPYRPSDIEP